MGTDRESTLNNHRYLYGYEPEVFVRNFQIFAQQIFRRMTTGARMTKVFLLTLAKHKQTKFSNAGKFSSEFELFQITFC